MLLPEMEMEIKVSPCGVGNGERDVDNEYINKFSLNSRMSEQNVDNEVEWLLEDL